MFDALTAVLEFATSMLPKSWSDWSWFLLILGVVWFVSFGAFEGFSSQVALIGLAIGFVGSLMKLIGLARTSKSQRG
ncbi:MAG TPA: hypothetical protein VF701_20250 [Thermoanaerobaculia bacterium]